MKNDKVVVAVEEERLTRIKHGLRIDVGKYSISKFGKHFTEILEIQTVQNREKRYDELIEYCLSSEHITFKNLSCTVISSLFPCFPYRYSSVYLQHHVAHCASAFFPSKFDSAAILVIDGYGSYTDGRSESVMLAFGEGNKISVIDTINLDDAVGLSI